MTGLTIEHKLPGETRKGGSTIRLCFPEMREKVGMLNMAAMGLASDQRGE